MRRFSPPKCASGKLVSASTSCARIFPSRSPFHLCKSLVALWWALMFLRSPPSPKTRSPCHASLSRSSSWRTLLICEATAFIVWLDDDNILLFCWYRQLLFAPNKTAEQSGNLLRSQLFIFTCLLNVFCWMFISSASETWYEKAFKINFNSDGYEADFILCV